MSTNTRISPTLKYAPIDGDRHICCVACGHGIVQSGEGAHWKDRAQLQTCAVSTLTGWSTSVHPDLELRNFSCPSCGILLDSETALPEDPFLYDTVEP